MPTDRVLIEIVSAANMSGIREAQAGFLGMSNALTAMTVGLGIAVIAGKSAVEIAEKHEKAESELAQAIKATGGNLGAAQVFLDQWIAANRAYIPDQAEVIAGYATLTRSGLTQTEVQIDMNRALDLAALKHISLTEATRILDMAEHGRLKGLADLGITTAKYTDAQGDLVASSHDVAKAMAELDQKTAHGRETTTQMSQATNRLSNDWQDIANNVGPPLLGMFDAILRGTDWLIQNLKALGQDKSWNEALSAGFGQIQNFALPFLETVNAIVRGIQWLANQGQGAGNPGQIAGALGASGAFAPYKGSPGKGARAAASGFEGIVSQPTYFLAGEAGSEEVNIRPQGRGASRSMTVNIHVGTFIGSGRDVDRFADLIAERMRLSGAF